MKSKDAPSQFIVSNPDKVLYPAARFTKADVVDYYARAAPFLLPHFRDRPVTLKRYPDGVRGEAFYEKDAPAFTPEWVKTFPVPRREGGPDINYIVINDSDRSAERKAKAKPAAASSSRATRCFHSR